VVDKYRSIWGENDAPIREHTFNLAQRVQIELASQQTGRKIFVKSAMTYGNPSIKDAFEALLAEGVTELMIIPLYPQYSAATTAPVFDKFSGVIAKTKILPGFRFISEYHREPAYIQAISQSIEPYVGRLSADTRLLFSFHGLPKAQVAMGDPYPEQCQATANLVVNKLGLESSQWTLTFQSRFGPSEWLAPYTSDTLADLPRQGVKHVILTCPGFAVDCLETLEEIEVMNKKIFLEAGGESFTYIPALNAEVPHVNLMAELISGHLYQGETSGHSTNVKFPDRAAPRVGQGSNARG
jgi:ferrochelatase